MEKGTVNNEGLKRGIWRPCCSNSKCSNLTKVKEIHLIGRLGRELDGIKSTTPKELITTIIPSFMC